MSLVGSIRGVQAIPQPCNSNSNSNSVSTVWPASTVPCVQYYVTCIPSDAVSAAAVAVRAAAGVHAAAADGHESN
jgi:hypothetical protein